MPAEGTHRIWTSGSGGGKGKVAPTPSTAGGSIAPSSASNLMSPVAKPNAATAIGAAIAFVGPHPGSAIAGAPSDTADPSYDTGFAKSKGKGFEAGLQRGMDKGLDNRLDEV